MCAFTSAGRSVIWETRTKAFTAKVFQLDNNASDLLHLAVAPSNVAAFYGRKTIPRLNKVISWKERRLADRHVSAERWEAAERRALIGCLLVTYTGRTRLNLLKGTDIKGGLFRLILWYFRHQLGFN